MVEGGDVVFPLQISSSCRTSSLARKDFRVDKTGMDHCYAQRLSVSIRCCNVKYVCDAFRPELR